MPRHALTERPTVRVEIASSGIDDSLQAITSDPFGAPFATGAGLRVPSFNPTNKNATQNRFLFLLATRQVQRRCRLVGIGQYLTIGTNAFGGEGSPQVRPLELAVTTPSFRFPDGNVSWHIVLEPNVSPKSRPLTDAPNFMRNKADGPALLYTGVPTFGADFTNPVTGAPVGGYAFPGAMTSYVAPEVQSEWRAIAGLGCFYDLRYAYNTSTVWSPNIEIAADSLMRISFYASVLQTAGSSPSYTTVPTPVYLPPEESFINSGWASSVFYWRIGGRLVFEDDLTAGLDCDTPLPKGPTQTPVNRGGLRSPSGKPRRYPGGKIT